jgi:hypothetical protein
MALLAVSALAGEKAGRIQVVGPASIDFGVYRGQEKKTAVYRIRNAGDYILKIIQVRKTCGCASANCDKKELNPGEDASVEVVILPNSIFGAYSKTTYIESTDPNNRFLCLGVAGNAVPLVEIDPKDSIYAGRIPLNDPWSQAFDLKPTERGVTLGQPLVESNHPVDAALKSNEASNGCYKLDVRMLPTGDSGDLSCSIKIPVLTPTNQSPLKIEIFGKIGTELCAVPSLVSLGVSDTPTTVHFNLRLLGQRNRVLEPEELKLPDCKEASFKIEHDERMKGLIVTATFTPEFTRQLFAEGEIPLSFSVSGASSATLTCKAVK